MRKKFLFIVLGFVFCSANIGFAQYVSLGLRAGVNASSLLGSYSVDGVEASSTIPPKNSWQWAFKAV